MVIIKKGEHGAFLFKERSIFFAPAYPLEDVFDPTGAGDSFAGGFMGYLARTGDLSDENLRRAVVYGSAMGSFAVERFSVQRLLEIDRCGHRARASPSSGELVAFEEEVIGVSDDSDRWTTRASGVDIDARDDVKQRIRASSSRRSRRVRAARSAASAACSASPPDCQRPAARLERGRRGHEAQASRSRPTGTTRSGTISSTTASTTSSCRAPCRSSSSTTSLRAARARGRGSGRARHRRGVPRERLLARRR